MSLLQRMLGELTVAVVRFADAEKTETTVYTVRCARSGPDTPVRVADTGAKKGAATLKGRPILFVAIGHGVISKRGAQASALADKVTAEPEKFVWSSAGADGDFYFSFMRREQLVAATGDWEGKGAVLLHVCCSAAERPDDAAAEAATLFIRESVNWKSLLRPTERGALLAGIVVRRLRLLVLALLLALLAGNGLLKGRLQQRSAAMRARTALLQKEQGEAGRLSDEKRRVLDDFRRRGPYRFSLFCDRIGRRVPDGLVLDGLQLLPFGEPGRNEKNATPSAPEIRIAGHSRSAETIAGFLAGLRAEAFASGALLRSVEQGREPGVFTFSIGIPL